MKKLFLLLALFASVSSFAQHQRRLLVEEFTQASCPPCASQNPGFNATLAANMDKVTPIKYQVWWPGTDLMYFQTKEDVDPRVEYYQVSGVPDGYLNGTTNLFPVNSLTEQMIDDMNNDLTPVTMTLTHQISPNYDSVYIQVSVTSDEALSGNLRLRVAVTEAELYFTSATAPGNNGELEFFDVMRKMLPNADGTETGDFIAGETKTYSFAWQLANFYNLNEVTAVAWLQDDDSKEVWQSERSEPNLEIPAAGTRIVLPVSQSQKLICTDEVTTTFNLRNVGTEPVTEAVIRYRVSGGNWVDYNWTGNLAPNTQASITLPTISLTPDVIQSVELFPASSNNGVQLDLINSGVKIKINSFQYATAPPVVTDFEDETFPPASWGIINLDPNGWQLAGVGAYGQSAQSTFINFYDITANKKASLILPKIDLTDITTEAVELSFDHAYTFYQSGSTVYKDSLKVQVSTDCGTTWTTVWSKKGDDLKTAPATGAAYVPAEGDWVTNSIDLSAYAGQEFLVRLYGESGYGNNLYIDNVNVTTNVGTFTPLQLGQFSIQPNPTATTSDLRFTLETPESLQLHVYAADGSLVLTQSLGDLPAGPHTATLDAAKLANGSYRLVLQGRQGVARAQWMIVK
jgi:hypothetical protein